MNGPEVLGIAAEERLAHDAGLAELVEQVLAREDAAEALDFVLAQPIGGPSCGCGASHWSCDFGAEDEDDYEPDSLDGWVISHRGRWFVKFMDDNPASMPENGYPDLSVAMYELATAMAGAGRFRAAWLDLPGSELQNIDHEVRALHDEAGDQVQPLIGVIYEPDTEVRLSTSQTWIVRRDYGALGVWVFMPGSPEIDMLATHDQVTPALREGQAVEYRSWATGPGRTPGTWTPAIFRGYGDQANATVTQLSGSGFVMSKTYEIRPVPAEVMTEARGWLSDNQWADADADDIAEAKDLDILRAIQRHYLFGWTGFRQNHGSEG